MDLSLDRPGDHHFVRSVDERGIRIGDTYHTASLLLTADRILPGWPPAAIASIEELHLAAIFDLRPEIVLLGTGSRQEFLPPRLMVKFYEAGVGLEVMTTAAACRTFNILVSDGRNVLAALMPPV